MKAKCKLLLIPILTLCLCVCTLVCASAETTTYTLKLNSIGYLTRSSEQIIEDYSSGLAWFSSNGEDYTRIRFAYDPANPANPTSARYIYMYYENIIDNTSVLACKFRDVGGLNSEYVPMWTSRYFQLINLYNQPYENAELFNLTFEPINYKKWNVSIGTTYKVDVLTYNWYDVEDFYYYGKFKIEDSETEWTTMVITKGGYNGEYLFVVTNEKFYTQYTMEEIDGKEIEMSMLYSYNTDIFPIYVDDEQADTDNWFDFFIAIIDVPIYYLYSLTNFEIFGVNVWLGLGTLVLAGFVMLLIKKVL